MKYVAVLICLVIFCYCEKKKNTTPIENTTSTTTGAVPTPTVVSYAAAFEVNSTDYNYGYASAQFYSNAIAITLNSVKLNGGFMALVPSNEYRSALSSSTYTSAVTWEIDSDVSFIPDTSIVSPPIPNLGFQKDITKTYNKALDFNITVDASQCDSLFCILGEVEKRIPGRSGINVITFYPADKVKYSVTDSTEVEVRVITSNYHLFTVRGKRWKSVSQMRSLSHYKYK